MVSSPFCPFLVSLIVGGGEVSRSWNGLVCFSSLFVFFFASFSFFAVLGFGPDACRLLMLRPGWWWRRRRLVAVCITPASRLPCPALPWGLRALLVPAWVPTSGLRKLKRGPKNQAIRGKICRQFVLWLVAPTLFGNIWVGRGS